MKYRVQIFAALRDATGSPELEVELPEGATVRDLKARVERLVPSLAGRLGPVRVAADFEFLVEADPIPRGAELALIPPVSGGALESPIMIELCAEDLVPGKALEFVRGPDAGGLATFLGTVRRESRGRVVCHLDYEAYGGMAVDRLSRIAAQAIAEKGALRAAILHRVGRVDVGGDSVVIAVAAAHRAAAFDACRQVIEALKADVPIWKREVYEQGDAWVGWGS